ncbi:sensor domain-containing diguanylate cyclase [Massilia sp. IC2-477]|uniref:sensor domain-containing diguanylate cyclase n=1 Tax=Massilia sp. IC2-477 TaxID=2887198 RepID=UPI001D11BF5F|nr:sensor domain-containing diguanylate cyclase [Massilia sp. IC2-477]MCC2956170.1 sensor domain-containing diguanylate cyclase [Massilia sp. IC2-477]
MIPKTLKGRLTAAVTALVAAACMLVTAVALEVAYREMKESTGRQQYALLTSAAAHLAFELDAKRTLLRTLAEEMAQQPTTGGARIQDMLAHHPGLRQAFADLVVLDTAGRIAGLQQPGYFLRSQLADSSCLRETVQTGAALTLQPPAGTANGRAVVVLTQPVVDAHGRTVLVLCGGTSLEDSSFFSQAARLRPGATGYLFALTRSGTLLYHPDRGRHALKAGDEAPLPAMARAAMQGWDGWTFGKDAQGTPSLLTYKQVGSSGWVLASAFPADEALAGISRARHHAWTWAAILAVCAGVVGWATMVVLLRPLRALRRHVHAVEREEADIGVLELERDDEIGALGRAFHSLSVKRQIAEQQLKELSLTDTLTGLGNRRQFDHEVALLIEQAARYRYGLAVAFLDVDCFKSINDTYGHAAGDAVLKEFARRLRTVTRPTDRSYRLAGDEFVIVSERLESGENARRFAAKILRAIRRPFDIGGGISLPVTTSIGVAVARFPVAPVGDLLQHADAALYQTKRSGRDGYTIKELGMPAFAAAPTRRAGLRTVGQ